MLAIVLLGLFAFTVTFWLIMPPSRELMLKLGTLIDMTRRADSALFAAIVEPTNPFVGRAFKHNRIKGVLRVDLSQFGEIPQRLQREARRLDQKAHRGMLPALVYLAGLGVWYAIGS